MNRLFSRLLVWAAFVIASPAPAQDIASHYRDAIQAYRDNDPARMLDAARAALALRPEGASLIYLEAAASAWSGEHDRALASLQKLASWGLSQQPDQEPTFAGLADDPRFAAVVEKFAANRRPVGEAVEFRGFDDGHFIPEGIAYDPLSDHLYLGSIRQHRIIRLSADGTATELVSRQQDGLLSVFGMRLDAGRLVVASSGLPESGELPDGALGRAGIFVFDAASGNTQAVHWLPADGTQRVLGDLEIDGERVYTTDSATGQVWRLDLSDGRWTELIAAGVLVSPQGLVVDASRGILLVADYRAGLIRVELDGGVWRRLEAPDSVCVEGIDGLYRHGGDLIAIQNGIRPNRIVRLAMDDTATRITNLDVLAASLDGWDEPTLGTIVLDRLLYVANSHWPRFDQNGALPSAETLAGPRVMAVALP